MEKKKLLFIMDTLGTGGGEKSLVSFLNNLDYDRFEVDLQLMSSGGEYERYVSDKVNILPNPEYFRYLKGERRGTFRMKLGRLMYSLSLRFGPNLRMTHARKFWTTVGPCIERNPKEYDVAIGFSQCIPTFYMIDKVSSKQKIAWVNCVFHLDTQEKERLWEKPYYQKSDKISLVSEAALWRDIALVEVSCPKYERIGGFDHCFRDLVHIKRHTLPRALHHAHRGFLHVAVSIQLLVVHALSLFLFLLRRCPRSFSSSNDWPGHCPLDKAVRSFCSSLLCIILCPPPVFQCSGQKNTRFSAFV